MEEDNVAIPGPSTFDVSPTLRKRAHKNVLNPNLTLSHIFELILLTAFSVCLRWSGGRKILLFRSFNHSVIWLRGLRGETAARSHWERVVIHIVYLPCSLHA